MKPLPDKSPAARILLVASMLGWLVCLAIAGPRLRGLLVNSALLAGGTLLLSVPIGTFLAVVVAKTSVWGKRWLERGLIVLLCVPLYVQATAWQATAGQGGWLFDGQLLSGWTAAIWIHAVAAVPWVVLFVAATLRKVPRELEEEALQDAEAWRVLLRVSLRQATIGIAAAALWVAVICFSEIAVTDLFRVRTFAEEIYTAASLGTLGGALEPTVNEANNAVDATLFAAADLWIGTLAVFSLVVAALSAIWIWLPATSFSTPAYDWVWHMRRGRVPITVATWCVAVVILVVPLLGLLGKAGVQVASVEGEVVRDWSVSKAAKLIGSSPWQHRREFGWSLAIGAVATITAVSMAVLIAWSVRTRRLPAWPTAMLLAVGFAIPGPLVGVWLIRCLNHPADSVLSPLTWCYDHTILAPVLAQLVRALPVATLIVGAQFANLPQDVLDSAKSEGADWWQRLLRIALPWSWPAVVAAACVAMIVSLGELAATLLVVPPGVSPLSVRIFGLLHYGAEDRVCALCLMLIAILTAGAGCTWWLARRLVSPAQ